MKYYKVSEKMLRNLLEAAHTYWALEAGGVDNWEWHGVSIDQYVSDCLVVDETKYDSIEDIVEEDMKNFDECIEVKSPLKEEFLQATKAIYE